MENGKEATSSLKTNVLNVWNVLSECSLFFPIFWVTRLKSFSGKAKQSVQHSLNQNLVIGSFLEHGFEASLSSKTNALSVWKEHFPVFWKFLSDEVETVFWEREAKRLKLFIIEVHYNTIFSLEDTQMETTSPERKEPLFTMSSC